MEGMRRIAIVTGGATGIGVDAGNLGPLTARH